jgi:hypothetical protein
VYSAPHAVVAGNASDATSGNEYERNTEDDTVYFKTFTSPNRAACFIVRPANPAKYSEEPAWFLRTAAQ